MFFYSLDTHLTKIGHENEKRRDKKKSVHCVGKSRSSVKIVTVRFIP